MSIAPVIVDLETKANVSPFATAGPIFRPQHRPTQRPMMAVQLDEPMRASLRLPSLAVERIMMYLGLRPLSACALVCRKWNRMAAEQRAHSIAPAHMLSLFVQLDTLANAAKTKKVVSGQGIQMSRGVARELTDLLESLATQMAPETAPKALLSQWQGLAMCPDAAEWMNLPTGQTDPASDPIQEYFKYLGVMNQVVALCRQIQRDVENQQHKYMAHQIALLYQSLGALGKPGSRAKKDIEANFARVKGMTEGSKAPTLPEEIQRWLTQKTKEVLRVAMPSSSPGIHDQLRPVTRLLR